jgi:uncharacterized Zn finger protein (UPF0148 family)
MVSCPQCGASLKEGAKFCHVCGYHLPETEQPPKQEIPAQETPKQDEFDVKTYTNVDANEVFDSVKSGGLFKRAIKIMFNPKQEWEVVAKETPKVPMLIFGYVLILSIIPLASMFLNGMLSGLIWGGFGYYMVTGIVWGVIYLVICVAATIISAVIINALAPAFKSEKNLGRAMQLVAYSITPMFFGGLLFIFPFISFLGYLVGFYGIFILWNGITPIMKTPKERQVGYFFTSAGIVYGVFWALWLIFWLIATLILLAGAIGYVRHF